MPIPVDWVRQDFLAIDHVFEGAVKSDAKAVPLLFVVGLDVSVAQIIPVAHDPIRDGLYRGCISKRHD